MFFVEFTAKWEFIRSGSNEWHREREVRGLLSGNFALLSVHVGVADGALSYRTSPHLVRESRTNGNRGCFWRVERRFYPLPSSKGTGRDEHEPSRAERVARATRLVWPPSDSARRVATSNSSCLGSPRFCIFAARLGSPRSEASQRGNSSHNLTRFLLR